METTRAAFLSRGARGGIALVAGGSVLAATAGSAFGAGTADTDIAKLAATAELLAIDFYSKAIGSKKFTGAEAAYMAAALQNEKDHYKALAGVLRSAAPKGITFAYPAGTFASAKSIGKLGQALETAFVGAYLGPSRRSSRTSSRASRRRSAPTSRAISRSSRTSPPARSSPARRSRRRLTAAQATAP